MKEIEVIASSEYYKIVYQDNDSDITFITFHGVGGDLDTAPFGGDFLGKNGFNVIGCSNKNGTRYQKLSFNEFERIVSPYVAGKKVFLYGSSLGGYCAIYYSGAVNGTVIAASPRNSNHPLIAKQNAEFNHALDIRENKLNNEKHPIYIFRDSKNINDNLFFNKIIGPAYPNASVFLFDRIGHANILAHLNMAGVLKKLILAIKDDNKILVNEILGKDYLTYFRKLSLAKMHLSACVSEKNKLEAGEVASVDNAIKKIKFNYDKAMFYVSSDDSIFDLTLERFSKLRAVYQKLKIMNKFIDKYK